jgi:hypothetical protein
MHPSTAAGKLEDAAIRIDAPALLAVLAIFVGWFFLDTLIVTLGSLRHGVRFFDISSAIADPTRIFFRIDASLHRIFFGLICLICLLAALLPYWRRSRLAWAAHLAPLALMLLCGVLLYSKTSSEFFSTPGDTASLGGGVIRFANDLVRRASGLVSRHISIGMGGYLAFAGSSALAALGIRRLAAMGTEE